ncbi:hypothetical protein H5410_047353 [Solanum commersonii]|uniref:Uncharacterized protein n=1 Tax=Solanum commersonii TaxID=4109 RepID=A0A9J5XH12_SOLCO|nr:hypothetical protein H5410_047353 [Solanum commersonii]
MNACAPGSFNVSPPLYSSFIYKLLLYINCASLTCPCRARVANAILFNSRNHAHKSDPTVDLIKRELPGAIAIKREAPTGDADDVATDVGVDVGVDVDVDVNTVVDIGDVGAKSCGEHVDDVGGIYGGFTPSRAIHSIED